MSQALSVVLARVRMSLDEGPEIPLDVLPDASRRALRSRFLDLSSALAAATREQIIEVLATLAEMPAQIESDPAKRKFMAEQAVADLAGLPEWALSQAARLYRVGEIGDGRWRPTAGELAKVAREKVQHWREEAFAIARALDAPVAPQQKPVDPERRKELADMMRGAVLPARE